MMHKNDLLKALIAALWPSPGRTTRELAEALQHPAPHITSTLRRMATQGLVRGHTLAGRPGRGAANAKTWTLTALCRRTYDATGAKPAALGTRVSALVTASPQTVAALSAALGVPAGTIRSACWQLLRGGVIGRQQTPDGVLWGPPGPPAGEERAPNAPWAPPAWVHPIRARALALGRTT